MIRISFICFLIIAACNSTKKPVAQPAVQSQSEQFLTKEDISLTFERTICYGTCPAYRIEVRKDGKCSYDGMKFTDKIGKYNAVITKDQFQQIVDEGNRIGYFTMEGEYDNEAVTDVPSVLIMICGPQGPKKVHDRMNAPSELRAFEKFIDGILLNLDWKADTD